MGRRVPTAAWSSRSAKIDVARAYSTMRTLDPAVPMMNARRGPIRSIRPPMGTETIASTAPLTPRSTPMRPILIPRSTARNGNRKLIIALKNRDKALILVGFSGGFRRSELVDINYDDLEFVDEGVKIFIKRSKTDQSGEGMTKAIPYFDNKLFCPVTNLKNWIDYSEINSGKIFDISDKSVALIIKKYASLSGLDSNRYAGHSLRSGFATSTAESGAEERNIMAMTGHKTTQMVRRYIQEANLFKNNALNKIKL